MLLSWHVRCECRTRTSLKPSHLLAAFDSFGMVLAPEPSSGARARHTVASRWTSRPKKITGCRFDFKCLTLLMFPPY
jgi:hypothetical protein